MKRLIFIAILAFAIPVLSYAEMSGREIIQKMHDQNDSKTSSISSVMVIKRGDKQLVRKMHSFGKKYGDDEKTLIKFEKPADVRDTMYLTWSYEDPEKEDDMWVYLPAESLVRRISKGAKKGAFMRSDFANEDIQKREVDDDTHKFLKMEEFSDINCYVVESFPVKKRDTSYSKKIVWVHSELFVPVKMDFYDKTGRVLKSAIYGGFKTIDGINVYTKILMETPRRRTKTFMERKDIKFNMEISDTVFQQSNLKR